jgi:hypothetical protein
MSWSGASTRFWSSSIMSVSTYLCSAAASANRSPEDDDAVVVGDLGHLSDGCVRKEGRAGQTLPSSHRGCRHVGLVGR